MRNKIIGGMMGLACGDALGAPAEFKTPQQLRAQWGVLTEMTGGGGWEPGEWTDDTSMALCVAEGVLANPTDPVSEVGDRFLEWFHSGPKDVGNATRSALSAYAGNWAEASKNTPSAQAGKAAGNGSLMRTLPIALAYTDKKEMLKVSARTSAMTHWDSQAEVCCAIYCLWVQGLLLDVGPRLAWETALGTARAATHKGCLSDDTPGPANLPHGFWERLEGVEAKRYDQLQPGGYAGYVLDCLEAAVWCCLKAEHFEQALLLAVNLAGEADTIAAVAGGAAGVMFGREAVPTRWLARLYQRERLEKAGERLADLRRHHEVYAIVRPSGYTGGYTKLPAFEFQEVADRIFAGRNPLTVRDVETLVAHGITHVLDLREEKEWAAPDRMGLEGVEALSRSGLVRKHLTVEDLGAPTASTLETAMGCLDEWLSEPMHRVYIHCRAGRERTGAVLTACYARKHGLTYDEALSKLQEVRPLLKPLPVQEKAVRKWLGGTTK